MNSVFGLIISEKKLLLRLDQKIHLALSFLSSHLATLLQQSNDWQCAIALCHHSPSTLTADLCNVCIRCGSVWFSVHLTQNLSTTCLSSKGIYSFIKFIGNKINWKCRKKSFVVWPILHWVRNRTIIKSVLVLIFPVLFVVEVRVYYC